MRRRSTIRASQHCKALTRCTYGVSFGAVSLSVLFLPVVSHLPCDSRGGNVWIWSADLSVQGEMSSQPLWIIMKFISNIHGSQSMDHNGFGDPDFLISCHQC